MQARVPILSRDARRHPRVKALLAEFTRFTEDASVSSHCGALSHILALQMSKRRFEHFTGLKKAKESWRFWKFLGATDKQVTPEELEVIRDLRGTGPRLSSYGLVYPPPSFDHGEFWNKNGKPYCISWDPYGFCEETLCGLGEWIKRRSWLSLEIGGGSDYWPGRTLHIEVKARTW